MEKCIESCRYNFQYIGKENLREKRKIGRADRLEKALNFRL